MIPLFVPPFWLIPILYVLFGGVGGLVVGAIIGALLPSKACSIAIFGSKGAGKSNSLDFSLEHNHIHQISKTLSVEF